MLAPHRRDLFMLPSAVLVTVPRAAVAQGPLLGTVRFSTSARSPETKAHFECGIAALHSFCYPVALEDFRAARRLEPGFAMALWGEAMAHNHPVWGDPRTPRLHAGFSLSSWTVPCPASRRASRATSTQCGRSTVRARGPPATAPMPRQWRG